jgi:MarR family transcriptional regulator, lower aerobic nicotinate degradation pathway regulator
MPALHQDASKDGRSSMLRLTAAKAQHFGYGSNRIVIVTGALRMWPLEQRPGFLIRRLHQIHVRLFTNACEAFGITPLQYSVMSALREHGPSDQSSVANLVFLDRTTTTGIIKRLHARGLVDRTASDADRRAQICRLTRRGVTLLTKMETCAQAAHQETVAPLPVQEQAQLIALLDRVVTAHEQRSGWSETDREPLGA